MNPRVVNEVKGLSQNLLNGLKSLIFKRVDLEEYSVSYDQLVILVLCTFSVVFIGSFFLSFPNPEFSIFGVATIASQLLLFSIAVYLYSKAPNYHGDVLSLLIMLLSVWPFFLVIWYFIGNYPALAYWQFYGKNNLLYIWFNLWLAAVIVRSMSNAINVRGKRIVFNIVIYFITIGVPLNYLYFGNLWHKSYNADNGAVQYNAINQENTYYNQFNFIESLRHTILPQRSGITDIYFVGFGSYDTQDVFMKEVLYAQRMFDDVYDTKGRSIALINNHKTMKKIPLASKSNLRLTLDHIGKLIDLNDDVLFLYLTSHGSKKHELSITMSSLELNSINPNNLKKILDSSGIKYRVILVSACYSGGYIEPLRDQYSLIFTASAKDKTSFGCSNKNDFTYFGRAIFKDNIEHNFNLIDVFEQAMNTIKLREQQGKLEHSDPKLYVGSKIREKLKMLTREIEKYNKKKM